LCKYICFFDVNAQRYDYFSFVANFFAVFFDVSVKKDIILCKGVKGKETKVKENLPPASPSRERLGAE